MPVLGSQPTSLSNDRGGRSMAFEGPDWTIPNWTIQGRPLIQMSDRGMKSEMAKIPGVHLVVKPPTRICGCGGSF